MRDALRWTQRILFGGGALILAYCAWIAADTWVFQQRAGQELQTTLVNHRRPGVTTVASSGLIGRLEIPRLGLAAVVIEGADGKALRRAVGHVPGTGLPGQAGNVVFTGHRDTFFRPLRNIRERDLILVTTPQGDYRYRVVSTRIVSPNEVAVLRPGVGENLTLITCYPFYFVGAAPDRFIVSAERLQSDTSAPSGPGGPNL